MDATYNNDDESAPWFNLPGEYVMCVEHPCIVKNNAKGIEMLGGARTVSHCLDLGTERTLPLTFNPDDPSGRTVLSLHHQTNDVLLRITVPKRTGRKRKRGSLEPFRESANTTSVGLDATHFIRSLQDNSDSYNIEAVAKVSSSHVWRSMPDFVFSSKASAFMENIERQILPKDYMSMRQFRLQRSYGTEDSDSIPPSVMSTQSMPYHYFYRQNQALIKAPESSGSILVNRSAAAKTFTHQWQYDNPQIPQGPMEGCPPLEDQAQQVQDIVHLLQPLFEQRPLWTRRALLNQLPAETAFFFAKHAMAYVAFTIRSGPWRDTLCRFGVDPRSDRKYRKYQTILLQIMQAQRGIEKNAMEEDITRPWVRQRDVNSHIFTGTKSVVVDGKVWQLCDLEDEQLKKLVDIEDLYVRSQCEIRYFGWYPNGTYAKLKILLKLKVDRMIAGKTVKPELFEDFLKLPDVVDTNYDYQGIGGGDLCHGYLTKDASKDELDWATAFRSVVRTPIGATPTYGPMGKGRTSIAKPKARPSYIGPEQDDGEEDAGDEPQDT